MVFIWVIDVYLIHNIYFFKYEKNSKKNPNLYYKKYMFVLETFKMVIGMQPNLLERIYGARKNSKSNMKPKIKNEKIKV